MTSDSANDLRTIPPDGAGVRFDRDTVTAGGVRFDRVAVTGADGFIARRFLELYADRFAHVVGLVRSFPANPVPGVEYRAGDVSLAHAMRFGVRDCDAVVHFAYDHRNRPRAVDAAENVVAACRAAGVRRLVHISTVAVYDQTAEGMLTEDTRAARWRDPYIESKLRIEKLLSGHWRAGYRATVILQPTIVYGPGGSWTEHAVRACRAGAVELPRGGAGRCNAVYVDDVAQGVLGALTRRLRDEGIAPPRYLINGPDDVSWGEFFTAHGRALAAAGVIAPAASDLEPGAGGLEPGAGGLEPGAGGLEPSGGVLAPGGGDLEPGAGGPIEPGSAPLPPANTSVAALPAIRSPSTDRLFADDSKKNLAMKLAFRPLASRVLFDLLRLRPPKGSGGGMRDPLAVFREQAPDAPLRFNGMGRLYVSAPCRASNDNAARDLGYAPRYDLQRGVDEIAAALQPAVPRIASPPPSGISIDLQREAPDATLHRRVCVIGTGLAGGALATRLLQRGDDVVIIEAGNGGAVADGVANVDLDNVGLDFGLAIYRDISLGGSGNAWRGLCGPRDAVDYEARDWVPLSGWPISATDLHRHSRDAAALLRIDDYGLFGDQSTIDGAAESARDVAFDRETFGLKYFLQTRPPRSFRHDLLEACKLPGGPLLLQNAPALELETNAEGTRIEKVLVKDGTGTTRAITADVFVVCAGALETPRLLLNSRQGEREGLGNGDDLVGRYLMDHPMVSLGQIRFRKPRTAPLYQALQLSQRRMIKAGIVMHPEVQRRERLPNHSVFLLPSLHRGFDDGYERARRALITARRQRLSIADLFTVATNPNVVQWALSYVTPLPALFRYADLYFIAEQTPTADSRVDLSDQRDRYGYRMARCNWQVSNGDIESMIRFNELLLAAFPDEHYEVSYRRKRADIEPGLTSAAHFCGTARMAGSPQQGVVDPDLKVWGVDNLYLCDASVFPTSGNANPGLGITTLALRLADHLR